MKGSIEEEVSLVLEPWKGSPYYADAEKWTHIFWDAGSVFRREFDSLDLTSVVELACGHGRHSEQIKDKAGKIVMLDVLEENIDASRKRLGHCDNISFLLGDGFTFRPLSDRSVTAIFCYDAMVHFSEEIIRSYLGDGFRVLKDGGMALFHHSNYDGPRDRHYGLNPHARNVMTQHRFFAMAEEAGFVVKSSRIMDWGNVKDLDCLTLLEKPYLQSTGSSILHA